MLQTGGCRIRINMRQKMAFSQTDHLHPYYHNHITMKMKENKRENEEEIIREMMQSEMKKAPENLRFRIMQQIETEKTLTPQKNKPKKASGNLLREMGAIFGTMYAVLALMVIAAYMLQGKDFLLTPQFIGTVALVASVFSLFWLITRLDDYLKEKKKR